MSKRAILPLAASLATLAAPATAHAGFGYSFIHSNAYYARPHHWYTNDGRKASDDFSRTGDPSVDMHEHHRDEHKNREAAKRRRLHKRVNRACDRLHGLYIIRHGFNKPNSLRLESGCELWADDDFYHETHLTEAFDAFGIGN